MTALLEVRDLHASYGASQALFGVSLDIAEGEVHALMGRNGMGKSTTVKCICRLLNASGTLRFDGQDLAPLRAHQAARLGIGLTPEGRRCFADLTPEESQFPSSRDKQPAQPRVATHSCNSCLLANP